MKLVFIFPTASINPGSVQKKVTNQIHFLNRTSTSCRGIFITSDDIKESAYTSEIEFVKIEPIKWKYFQSFELKYKRTQCIIKLMMQHKDRFDYFILRYPMADFWLFSFLRKFSGNVVFEHLTDERAEIKMYQKQNAFRFKVSSLLSYFEHLWYPMLNERLFGKSMNKSAKYLIYNSQEIANHQLKDAEKNKVFISGDAVEVRNFRIKKTAILNDRINLVFLKGSSTTADFNGLDRLIKSILNYKGKYQIHFYILGKNLKNEAALIPKGNENIILKPAIYGTELDNFLDEMHLGVSTLALFRKQLHTTTTIKTREYFARGLPFIYAYNDTDMERYPETKAYALQYANDESELDLNALTAFVEQIYKQTNHAQEMRKLAESYLSYEVKMKRIIDFLSK